MNNCNIDKILLVSAYEVVIYFANRPRFVVYSSRGGAINLALQLLGLDTRVMLNDDCTQGVA